MTNLSTRESHPLTVYKAQGLGHIFTLAGIVTAGTLLVSFGGGLGYAAPLALYTCHQLFRSAGKVKDPSWCRSRDEIWGYRLSPKHKSISNSYEIWCKEWGTDAINGLIEPMIGNCELCNFTKDKRHPYHKLRGVLTYDDGELIPLTPHEYVSQRLSERLAVLEEGGLQTIEAELAQGFASLPKSVSLVTDTLQDRLKIDCPELLLLVKAPPIRLVGHQRTGKSSLARKLALLRLILLPGHKAAWCTPHLEQDNRLPVELNPIGFKPSGAKDMGAIEGRWIETQESIDAGKQLNQTIVWDEFGCYGDFENPDAIAPSLRSLLRESSKHEYYPILIAHGDQANFYPGVKNILTTLKQGTVKIETIGEAADDFGTMRPTGKFRIYDYGGENFKELQLPPWLTEDYLLGLLPKIPQTFAAIAQPTQVYPVEYQTAIKVKLEEAFKLSSAEPTQINEVGATSDPVGLLKEPLDEIGRYIISKGGEVEVSALKNWGRCRRKGTITSEEIQDCLLEMMEMSLIETFTPLDRKGEFVKWVADKNK